jgi:hypothetical protein
MTRSCGRRGRRSEAWCSSNRRKKDDATHDDDPHRSWQRFGGAPLSQDPVTEAFPESQSWTNGKGEVRGGGGILQIKTRRGASALTGGAASAEERWRLHGSVEEMAKGETSNERRLKGLFGLRVAWNRVASFQFFRTEPLRSA